ncbi:mediator of RNA polymerase II transcription subunit 13-like [Branchiostoma floridae x Branchiostoma belcheri]
MSATNSVPNGCSLEDCHSNVFALTDLTGIKWRRLRAPCPAGVGPLEDPILSSFAKCLAADVFCVWRRLSPSTAPKFPGDSFQGEPSTPTPKQERELWIFWYGDDPDLTDVLHPELKDVEQGSWEKELSYECRTLLFKALHNLLERYLLSADFVRLGRWFVRPYIQGTDKNDKCEYLSCAFSFFLHGESTVCTSVEIQEHQLVERLSVQHFNNVQGTAGGFHVLLSPYGLHATLTGRTYKASDPTTHRLLDEWKHFYPLSDQASADVGAAGDASNTLPVAVEVVVGGVRMCYPTEYVVVPMVHCEEGTQTGSGGASLSAVQPVMGKGSAPMSTLSSMSLTPPTSPLNQTVLPSGTRGGNLVTGCPANAGRTVEDQLGFRDASPERLARKVATQVWQDSCVTTGVKRPHPDAANNAGDDGIGADLGNWDFIDPTQKVDCKCSRQKVKSRSSGHGSSRPAPSSSSGLSKHTYSAWTSLGGTSSKHKQSDKSEKQEKQQQPRVRPLTPFHHRVPTPSVDSYMGVDQENFTNQRLGLGMGPLAGGGGQGVDNKRFLPTPGSVESSHSAAPSPLVAPSGTASSSLPGERTMPTLSPHPIVKKENDMGPPTVTSQRECSLPFVNNTAVVTEVQRRLEKKAANEYKGLPPESEKEDRRWKCYKLPKVNTGKEFHRPALAPTVFDTAGLENGEEGASGNLPDLTVRPALGVLERPLKKMKTNFSFRPIHPAMDTIHSDSSSRSLMARTSPGIDPYEFMEDSSPPSLMPTGFPPRGKSNKKGRLQSLSSQSDRNSTDSQSNKQGPEGQNQPGTAKGDPAKSGDKEPKLSSPQPAVKVVSSTSLTTEADLAVTFSDLDQLFESSDSDNDDGGPSTSGGAKSASAASTEDTAQTHLHKSGVFAGGTGNIGPADLQNLQTMFPTPPSVNPSLSPCNAGNQEYTSPDSVPGITKPDGHAATTLADYPEVEVDESMGSPVPEQIKDWSYVYRKANTHLHCGSSMYAPLKSLPSHKLPPIRLKDNMLYKPSWQMPVKDYPTATTGGFMDLMPLPQDMISSTCPVTMTTVTASNSVPMASPAFASVKTPRSAGGPGPYDSPPSTVSSFRNVNSVDMNSVGPTMEAHSLTVNMLLSDSAINLFKDRNFDSCVICVCNVNIKGADVEVYLPEFHAQNQEAQYKCTCGFSAVMNRKYARKAGLFPEDLCEIFGFKNVKRLKDNNASDVNRTSREGDSSAQSGKTDDKATLNMKLAGNNRISKALLQVVQDQCSSLYSTPHSLDRIVANRRPAVVSQKIEVTICDDCDACHWALEQGRSHDGSPVKLDQADKAVCQHTWPPPQAVDQSSLSSRDVVRMLQSLQPLLQDAIQKKRTTRLWEPKPTVQGPLTWSQFHRLVGRGGDENSSEPLPVPSLLVGYEKDWLSLSPFALNHWEKLLLEPFGTSRDVVYVVICPDNDTILSNAKAFFRELSTVYESCRLGRHRPITTVLRDGIRRVGKVAAERLADKPVDEWFNKLDAVPVGKKLKLYAQVCKHDLAAHLATVTLDTSLLKAVPTPGKNSVTSNNTNNSTTGTSSSGGNTDKPPSVPPPPSSGEGKEGESPKDPNNTGGENTEGGQNKENKDGAPEEVDEEAQPLAVVVYIVDPFSMGPENGHLTDVYTLGLLKCYTEILQADNVMNNVRNNISLQIIPVQQLVQPQKAEERATYLQHLKTLAFSVFTQSHRTLQFTIHAKSVTGFGPSAQNEAILKSKETDVLHLYTPPYILAPQKDKQTELVESFGELTPKSGVLFCAYCLSSDQRWLLATVTDLRGELLDTVVISVEAPISPKPRKVTACRMGLQKLWEFVLSVIATTTFPWRIVIGKLGRIGHGELKDWSSLLSRQRILKSSRNLKEVCRMCSMSPQCDCPTILSACMVSLEPESALRIFHESVMSGSAPGARPGGLLGSQLSTPRDASCTHLMAFPTSATTQAAAANFNITETMDLGFAGNSGDMLGDDDLLPVLQEDLGDSDLNQFLGLAASPTALTSPVHSPQSPTGGGFSGGGQSNPYSGGGDGSGKTSSSQPLPDPDEIPMLLQQPLALGYFISTAPIGDMPKSFWSSCPHAEGICPVYLKSALHVHTPAVQQNSEEILQSRHSHPLDSNLTCDVLRYVLESYNALSWLTYDPVRRDRRSCLPVHMVVLTKLYNTMATLLT